MCSQSRVVIVLHWRNGTHKEVAPICRAIVRTASMPDTTPTIAVAFDLQEHGARRTAADASQSTLPLSWPPRGISDSSSLECKDDDVCATSPWNMFSVIDGTARDVSYLIDYMPLFASIWLPVELGCPSEWSVLGVSLGAHAAMMAFFADRRITKCVSILGCGDYRALMLDRWEQRRGGQARRQDAAKLQNNVKTVDDHETDGSQVAGMDLGHDKKLKAENELNAVEKLFPGFFKRDPWEIVQRNEGANSKLEKRRSLYFLGGGRDSLVPVWASERLLLALEKPPWSNEIRVHKFVDPEAAHELSEQLAAESLLAVAELN